MPEETERKKAELSRIAMEAQAAQQQGASIQNQLNSLGASIIETKATLEALKNLEGVKDKEVILPIGSGVFINASVAGKGKVLVELGANIIAEKPFQEASELLEKRLKNIEEARDKLQAALEGFSTRLRELDRQAKTLISEIKEG